MKIHSADVAEVKCNCFYSCYSNNFPFCCNNDNIVLAIFRQFSPCIDRYALFSLLPRSVLTIMYTSKVELFCPVNSQLCTFN